MKDGNMATYCGLDCCLTYEIDEVRRDLRRNDTLIYDFERAMQGPCLEMMTRGFLVDIDAREQVMMANQSRRDATERVLQAIISAILGHYNPKFPNSPKQLQHLFYEVMKLKPIERWSDGEKIGRA